MKRRAGPILIAIAFVAMLAWTWGGWPDPIVDFGRELYVPWQLSVGKVLYRDIAHFNGPLSPYFNSLLFRVLGVSLRTLEFANIAIAAAMVAMIWQLFCAAGGRLSATVACLSFITLFMAIQLVTIGNYNWITPYSHELTHGIALSFAAILALMIFTVRPRASLAVVIGLLLGLVFLTKPEVFAAALPAVVFGFVLTLRMREDSSARMIAAFAIGVLGPILISLLLFSVRGTLGGWSYLFDHRLSGLPFYRINMGTDDGWRNLGRALLQLLAYLAVLAPAAVLDRITVAASRRTRIIIAATYIFAVLDALWPARHLIPWHDAFRGVMPAILLAAILLMTRAIRRPSPKQIVRATLAIFAALLLAKIALATRLYHYGFALAMPAMLVLGAIGVSWNRFGCTLRAATIAALSVITAVYLAAYAGGFHDKPVVVAPGSADEFRADLSGRLVNDVLAVMSAMPKEATLVVVPQGAMINYLSGRANPTPYVTLMPPEILMFGDEKIRDAYARSPPDLLVLIESDYREYGFDSFDGYAPLTASWMRENYRRIDSPLPDQVRLFIRQPRGR